MQPTPEQQQAIDARGHTLLVSAAAGSGKTATLTQRIITRLTDPAHPTELSRLLVVTFTRAAARELRERIGSALRKALAQDPKNAHLTRQLLLLPGAKIRTIDSFCNDLVRQNADLIGFPTKFRIADEAEGALLRRDVLEELLHDGYAGTLPGVPAADFCTLSDALCTLWQEKNLSEVLDALHAKVSSYREKGGLFLSVAESITGEEEFFRTPWGKVLYNDITGKLSDLLQQFRVLGEEIEKTGIEKEQAQLPVIEQDCALLQRLLTAAQEGYTPLRRAYADAAPAKRPNLPQERSAAAAAYADLRADWAGRAGLKPLPALRYKEEELQDACRQDASLHRTLGAVLTEFDRRYTEEKFRPPAEFKEYVCLNMPFLTDPFKKNSDADACFGNIMEIGTGGIEKWKKERKRRRFLRRKPV